MRGEREFAFTMKDFKFIASLVYDQTGIVLSEKKFEMMYSRLARRLRALKLDEFTDYVDFLKSSAGRDEAGFLVNAMTTNLTRFFREGHQLKHLAQVTIPNILKDPARKNDRTIRIWSAGCSSGQEPYSLAIMLDSVLKGSNSWRGTILATDIDTQMLSKASAGIYPEKEIETMPPNFRQRYVQKLANGNYQMGNVLRNMITFKRLNLMGDWPMKQPFDVIFCRNVVIYFDPETKANLIRRYAKNLKLGGMLYLGHSESMIGHVPGLQPFGRASFKRVP